MLKLCIWKVLNYADKHVSFFLSFFLFGANYLAFFVTMSQNHCGCVETMICNAHNIKWNVPY